MLSRPVYGLSFAPELRYSFAIGTYYCLACPMVACLVGTLIVSSVDLLINGGLTPNCCCSCLWEFMYEFFFFLVSCLREKSWMNKPLVCGRREGIIALEVKRFVIWYVGPFEQISLVMDWGARYKFSFTCIHIYFFSPLLLFMSRGVQIVYVKLFSSFNQNILHMIGYTQSYHFLSVALIFSWCCLFCVLAGLQLHN